MSDQRPGIVAIGVGRRVIGACREKNGWRMMGKRPTPEQIVDWIINRPFVQNSDGSSAMLRASESTLDAYREYVRGPVSELCGPFGRVM